MGVGLVAWWVWFWLIGGLEDVGCGIAYLSNFGNLDCFFLFVEKPPVVILVTGDLLSLPTNSCSSRRSSGNSKPCLLAYISQG